MKYLFRLLVILPLAFILAACESMANDGELRTGMNAPSFTMANAVGGEVSLSDYSGQPVLLYFHMAVG